MLKKIKIEGLFNKFNYEIELKEERITILTGPNGYGKTTILKIIHAFATKNMAFFFLLPFKEIVFTKENDDIKISKIKSDEIQINNISLKKDELISKLNEFPGILRKQILEKNWANTRGIMDIAENFLFFLQYNNPEIQAKIYIERIPDLMDVYFIREQRLLRKAIIVSKKNISPYFVEEETQENLVNAIEEYSMALSLNIKEILANASRIAQELDSSFPRRLFDETRQISKDDFDKRYSIIKEKQKSLSKYGLSSIKEDSKTSFKEENAKVLLVYLDDIEKKLAVFDDILQKLEIFSSILNQKFVFKHLEISSDFGFLFKTENGKELSLKDLSSGEQHEVVLLYELLFKVSPDTLVLIDEPEISLHVAWQKEVLNDLLKIAKLQKINIIIATHSPQIIGNHWDLTVDLWDLSNDLSKGSKTI